jgi:hypothetical protein
METVYSVWSENPKTAEKPELLRIFLSAQEARHFCEKNGLDYRMCVTEKPRQMWDFFK